MKRIMKKVWNLLLIACIICSIMVPAFAENVPVLSFELTSGDENTVYVKSGDIITVSFSVRRTDAAEAYHLNSLDNDIEYDSSFFAPVGKIEMVCGGQAAGAFDQRLVNDQTIVRVSDMSCEYAAKEVICSFELKVIGTTGRSVLRCSEELAYDMHGNKLAVSSDGLNVIVGDSDPGPGHDIGDSTPAPGGTAAKDCLRDEKCPIDQFLDTSKDAWWHDGIHYCIENGLMNGISGTAFAPNATMNRAMIVTIIWRMENSPFVSDTMTFRDVPADTWYTEAVRWAQTTGIVSGYDADSFGPEISVTREQLVAMLYRYAQMLGLDTTPRADLSNYEDADQVSDWAVEAMRWAVGAGLVQGTSNTTISPKGTATRAQAATFIMRFMEDIIK